MAERRRRRMGEQVQRDGKTFVIGPNGEEIELLNPGKPLEAKIERRSEGEKASVKRIESRRRSAGRSTPRPTSRSSGVSTEDVKQERRVQRSQKDEARLKRELTPKKRLRPRI